MSKINKSVQVVLINPDGYVLGVSRKDNHNDMGLVGGSMEDYDNSPEEAAIRETREETGLEISNLREIYSKEEENGKIGYTYLADYKGEIDYDKEKEPHLVKWTHFQELMDGSFGAWNKEVFKSLQKLGVSVRLTDSDCGRCVKCTCGK